MTEAEREQKIQYLRDQRDGIISGGYRDLLVATYNSIQIFCSRNPEGWCNPYNNQICMDVYGNTYHVPMIAGYISTLKSLGYIRIEGRGASRKIYINKEIDF